jgi:hypothetical protein
MRILKGSTLEEQMKSVDTILSRQSRRLNKTAKAIVTPFPISNYVDIPIDNVVMKYMFPADGTISVGYLCVEKMPREGVNLLMRIDIGELYREEQMFVKKSPLLIKPNISISAGSRLTVSVVPREGEISGVWIAFLWSPEVKNAVIKKFLIDELENQKG